MKLGRQSRSMIKRAVDFLHALRSTETTIVKESGTKTLKETRTNWFVYQPLRDKTQHSCNRNERKLRKSKGTSKVTLVLWPSE